MLAQSSRKRRLFSGIEDRNRRYGLDILIQATDGPIEHELAVS